MKPKNLGECRNTFNEIKVKLQRANGGCLGTDSRRKTCKAAISLGELLKDLDPRNSEWGNPAGLKPCNPIENTYL